MGNYDATVLGVPFDGGTTYRPGTRFGPQGVRKISALYTPYNFEMGVDLREQMTLADVGDVFTIPANIEKTFDQISNAVAHVAASGSMPFIIGGDHSIGFPCVRGIASVTSKKIGIIHVDRHADIQGAQSLSSPHPLPCRHLSTGVCEQRRTWTSGCTPRRGTTPRSSRTCRPPTSSRSASAAGRCRASRCPTCASGSTMSSRSETSRSWGSTGWSRWL